MISWQTHQILQPDLRPELFRKDLRQKKGVQAFGLWASHSSNGFLARLRRAATPSLSLPSAQQPPSPISAPHHTVGLWPKEPGGSMSRISSPPRVHKNGERYREDQNRLYPRSHSRLGIEERLQTASPPSKRQKPPLCR